MSFFNFYFPKEIQPDLTVINNSQLHYCSLIPCESQCIHTTSWIKESFQPFLSLNPIRHESDSESYQPFLSVTLIRLESESESESQQSFLQVNLIRLDQRGLWPAGRARCWAEGGKLSEAATVVLWLLGGYYLLVCVWFWNVSSEDLFVLYRVFFYCSALKMTKCQPRKEISELFLPNKDQEGKKFKLPNCSYPTVKIYKRLTLRRFWEEQLAEQLGYFNFSLY